MKASRSINNIAYEQGQIARIAGWPRKSPYDGTSAETYWLAGYDGNLKMEHDPTAFKVLDVKKLKKRRQKELA